MGFIAHSSNSRECCRTGRWFHVWCLPVLWLLPVTGLWCVVVLRNQHGDANMLAALASIAGSWLVDVIPEQHGDLAGAVTSCTGGILVMVLVGLSQDVFRVPRRIIKLYLAAPLVSFSILHVLLGVFNNVGGLRVYLQLFLFHFCMALYVFSVGSCIVYLVLSLWRLAKRRLHRVA